MDSKETKAQHEHQQREKGLDKTLADSFPSSDPPSTIPDPLMEESSDGSAGSSNSGQGIADRTNRAFKDTAQTYLDRAGIKLDLQQVECTLRQKPLAAAAIATAAGFIVGGGMGTRLGSKTVGLLSRKMAGDTASNLVAGIVRTRTR
jgi:hypothetical protein